MTCIHAYAKPSVVLHADESISSVFSQACSALLEVEAQNALKHGSDFLMLRSLMGTFVPLPVAWDPVSGTETNDAVCFTSLSRQSQCPKDGPDDLTTWLFAHWVQRSINTCMQLE